MFTAFILTAALACKPFVPPHPHPVQTTLRCEGADQVRRNVDGFELERWRNAPQCTVVRCEGADQVRRTVAGFEVARWSFAPSCMSVRCEGGDQVRRDSRGLELERWSHAPRCLERVRLSEPVRFGLSARG